MGKREKKSEARQPRLEPMFETPFGHPLRLSDPFNDFYGEACQKRSQEILDKAPCDLDSNDYWYVYQRAMPAGNFEECAFYFPWALAYLCEQKDGAAQIVSNLVGWAADHHDELIAADRLIDRVRTAFLACLERWTAEFQVVHFDRSACREKGWTLYYEDFVTNSGIVCELIDELCHKKVHADIAVAFVETLASTQATTIQSAWYLELVREFNIGSFKGGKKKNRGVLTALRDEAMWKHHASVVLEAMAPTCPSPTYWNDTLFFI